MSIVDFFSVAASVPWSRETHVETDVLAASGLAVNNKSNARHTKRHAVMVVVVVYRVRPSTMIDGRSVPDHTKQSLHPTASLVDHVFILCGFGCPDRDI